jgi:ribosome recycling factor
MTEDELKGAEEKIQKITDKYTDKVDEAISRKEKEVMEV